MADGINDNACNSKNLGFGNLNQNSAANETKITINQAFNKAARWQIIVTLIICIAFLLIFGVRAAISALMGGGIVLAGGYAGVMMTHRKAEQSPGAVLITLLKAEAIKILVICLGLLVIFRFYNELIPLALIGGLAASVLVSGAGLRAVGNNKK